MIKYSVMHMQYSTLLCVVCIPYTHTDTEHIVDRIALFFVRIMTTVDDDSYLIFYSWVIFFFKNEKIGQIGWLGNFRLRAWKQWNGYCYKLNIFIKLVSCGHSTRLTTFIWDFGENSLPSIGQKMCLIPNLNFESEKIPQIYRSHSLNFEFQQHTAIIHLQYR